MSFFGVGPKTSGGGSGTLNPGGTGSGNANSIARWFGVGGLTLQGSGVYLDDLNNITGVNSLTVTTLIATTTITTGDNIIMLNDQVVGVPTTNAGIEVERGTSTNVQVLWNESAGRWQMGIIGSLSNVVREADIVTTVPLQHVGSSFSITQAGVATDGYLSSTDWNIFNQITSGTIVFDPSKISFFFDDFNIESTAADNVWSQIAFNGGAVAQDATLVTNIHPGIVKLSLGNTVNSYVGLRLTDLSTGFKLGGGVFTQEFLCYNASINNNYELCVGIGDTPHPNTLEHANGVYFWYNHTSSANWQTATANSSVITKTVTSVAVVSGSWIKLKIIINVTASSVAFYINGVLVATHITNIPGSTTLLDIIYKMKANQLEVSGIRAFFLDYHVHSLVFSSSR